VLSPWRAALFLGWWRLFGLWVGSPVSSIALILRESCLDMNPVSSPFSFPSTDVGRLFDSYRQCGTSCRLGLPNVDSLSIFAAQFGCCGTLRNNGAEELVISDDTECFHTSGLLCPIMFAREAQSVEFPTPQKAKPRGFSGFAYDRSPRGSGI
jgi:hypothetical protein